MSAGQGGGWSVFAIYRICPFCPTSITQCYPSHSQSMESIGAGGGIYWGRLVIDPWKAASV